MNELFRSPAPVLCAKSVAIVGATEKAGWPVKIFNNLKNFGYTGTVYPINPRYQEIWGEKCYPNFASLPSMPDHALLIIPAKAVQETLEEATEAGLRAATVYAANLGEGHRPEVIARGEALKALCERTGLLVTGPNTMGCLSMRERYFAYPNPDLCTIPTGSIGGVFQSGGTLQIWCRTAADRGMKFSYMIASGNELSLDLADYVNFLVEDEHTKTIVLFIEGIRRPQAFMAAAAKALAAGKPIIAIKSGKTQKSQQAAQSHTGAISGDYDLFKAMCERYGIVLCDNLEEMIEVAMAFQGGRLPKGNRMGVFTISGGAVDLLYDYVEEIGSVEMADFSPDTKDEIRAIVMPEVNVKNPLDALTLGAGGEKTAGDICAAIVADPNIDMLAWAGQLPTNRGPRDPEQLKRVWAATDKPIVNFSRMRYSIDKAALDFQDDVGVPFLEGLHMTVRAMGALAFYGARVGKTPAIPQSPADGAPLNGDALQIALAKHGLTPPKNAFAASPHEAANAAEKIGFPVALKIVSPQISHKTEVDGVRLNLKTASEVRDQAEALVSAVKKADAKATLSGFLIQEMVNGVEVILGARTDPLYGPMIMAGSGGILVELVKDTAFRLLPVEPADARAMIDELKLAKLLRGYRGKPPADTGALILAICGLSAFYLAHRHYIADIECNPLIVLPMGQGVRAVDIRQSFIT